MFFEKYIILDRVNTTKDHLLYWLMQYISYKDSDLLNMTK